MSMAFILIKRNIKLFFKDKGMFFTSLITPAILLVLYVTFLGNVYRDSFTSNLPNSLKLSESITEGLVGGQLISSILAVSCVTVAFCSNFLMVQDKANGTIRDLRISPVKSATLSLSYYVATLLSTLIICFAATGICLTYVAIVGWYMSLADIFFLFLDILLLVLFGTALSSIINFFLSFTFSKMPYLSVFAAFSCDYFVTNLVYSFMFFYVRSVVFPAKRGCRSTLLSRILSCFFQDLIPLLPYFLIFRDPVNPS